MGIRKNNEFMDAGQEEKNIQLETVYKQVLPKLNSNYSELVSAHILLVLRLEGIVGNSVSEDDYKMIEGIKSKLLKDKKMKSEMIQNIKDMIEDEL